MDTRRLVMSPSDDLFRFIGSSFRSVWALELLLLLKRDSRPWSRDELITALRASELVVNKTLEELLAAGVISIEGDQAVYQPASADMRKAIDQVEKLYSARPDAVRRAIVSTASSGATAFADAFRLRKD
jgi:biotin operon repressor